MSLASLIAYKSKFGDCNVPRKWPANPKLGNWVAAHRNDHKANKLDGDCIRRLDELDFVWDQHDAAWAEMYESLVAYRDRFGDCKVPVKWPENPKLGRWVSRQRTHRETKRPKEDRIHGLNKIGFEWSREKKRAKSDREAEPTFLLAETFHHSASERAVLPE